MNLYEFIDLCREQGLEPEEAQHEYLNMLDESRRSWEESYYEDPDILIGARQQDMVDLYRFER